MEGHTDGHTDIQRETIITHHYHVAGYKNVIPRHIALEVFFSIPKTICNDTAPDKIFCLEKVHEKILLSKCT